MRKPAVKVVVQAEQISAQREGVCANMKVFTNREYPVPVNPATVLGFDQKGNEE